MLPLAPAPMLRSVLVRMPRQAMAVLSVMEPAMGRATGQGTKESGLRTALALEPRNNAIDPPTFDIATGAASRQTASVFSYLQDNAEIGFFRSHQTGIMTTGTVVHLSTRSATLPKLKWPSLPRLAITTMSIF
jgi:hypothetical protein